MKTIQEFYNNTPFPSYDISRFNSEEDLIHQAGSFAKILNRSIKKDLSVIDVGTGTGQLSAYLSLYRKEVYGIDFSDSSLNKAKKLKKKLNLDTLTLKKIDIMDPSQIKKIDKKFDYVLCLGVLHHTEDAYQGFKNILPLLKPNGFIAIGLYNRYGRFLLYIRRLLSKTIFKDNQKVKDTFLKMQLGDNKDMEKTKAWWNDQYLHPHETTHTIGEVLRWFKENNIEYYQTVPTTVLFDTNNLDIAGVWNKYDVMHPYLPIRIIKQLQWIFTTHKEGGYWITFGKNGK